MPPRPGKFDEALAFFRARVPITKKKWEKLSAENKAKAFTIANVTQLRIIADVHKSLTRAVSLGEPFAKWKARSGPALVDAWGGENPAHLETIFRNATQTAFSSGRMEQLTQVEALVKRPYWELVVVKDERNSPICAALRAAKVVLPADHKFWQTHIPPLHHRCRTRIVSHTPDEADERGVSPRAPRVKAAEGWGADPRGEKVKVDLSDVPPALAKRYRAKV